MSTKYPGGFITKSPVAPTTTAASGIWTLDQQQQAQKAGTWPSPPIFIEDLFSTYLVTGDGTAPAVNSGIDVSGQGGLVWIKKRSAAGSHSLFDTARGANLRLISNDTAAQDSVNLSFTSTGFSNYTFDSGVTYASWTFRKQPKFFDVVTYTGDGVTGRTVAHGLGSVPGFIIVKPFSTSGPWAVAARKSDGDYAYGASTYAFGLNSNEQATSRSVSGLATDTTFTPAAVADVGTCNNNGVTYVAYLFAHNAGGFPVSGGGSTNGISCGSWTGTGSTFTVNLGYEPQWLMFKRTDDVGDWIIIDNMRGVTVDGADAYLRPNTSGAESNITGGATLNSTGFSWATGAGSTFIYIAIRRGPMRVPTVGTTVFAPTLITATQSTQNVTSVGFSPDLIINGVRSNANYGQQVTDRLRGVTKQVFTEYDSSEGTTNGTALVSLDMTGFTLGSDTAGTGWNAYSGYTSVKWSFKRAPSFFDEVCYTGTGSNRTVTHNLGAVPELMIVKSRGTNDWAVYNSTSGATQAMYLNNTTAAFTLNTFWNDTTPTSTLFTVGTSSRTNESAINYVAYLFATCAGVSKVGSYTGTGALQTVNCGFTSGARFVLIKRTDSTGDWWTYDSARGITSGNDPYLFLNTASAEVTGTNYVDTDTTGFKVTAAAPAGLNANGGTYIFLAIA